MTDQKNSINHIASTRSEGREFILASQSPRRKELLGKLDCHFRVEPSFIEEKIGSYNTAEDLVRELALLKAHKRAQDNPEGIVIGCDTVVVLEGEVLGQPVDKNDAFRMLKMLNNKTHQVVSGLALVQKSMGKEIFDIEKSFVRFKDNSDEKLREYILTGEPMDKAGAYAIQGHGSALVASYKGCYHNIVGFPIELFRKMMKEFFSVIFTNPMQCTCRTGKTIEYINIKKGGA